MKIWSSSHTFSHPWETVVHAASRKYPNPINTSVTGVDVLERSVCPQKGVLRSQRLLSTSWGMPSWVIKLVGMEEECYVKEHSEIDPRNKTMTLRSSNLTYNNIVNINEELTYHPDPADPNRTVLKQEATITVNGVPMTSYCENVIKSTINSKAQMGRQAIEWVIDRLKEETQTPIRNVFTRTPSL